MLLTATVPVIMMAFLALRVSCLDNNMTMKHRFLVGKGMIWMLNPLPERLLKERDHYGRYRLSHDWSIQAVRKQFIFRLWGADEAGYVNTFFAKVNTLKAVLVLEYKVSPTLS